MSNELVVSLQPRPIEYAISAWLHEKASRSGSEKTRRNYEDAISRFRAALQRAGLDLDSSPRDVADVAQAWASVSFDGQQPVGQSTTNQRLAALSSFYTFARKRQHILLEANPIDLLDRKPVQSYAAAIPLSPAKVGQVLRAINRNTLQGKRDYALLTVALSTGRRLAELAAMRWGEVQVEDAQVTVMWPHAKGNKVLRDTLPAAVGKALVNYVDACYGETLTPDCAVWVSLAHDASHGNQLSERSIANIVYKHLGTSKVHTTRHTFAHAMEEAGASVSEIQSRLGHASLATTGRYLASLRSAENKHGEVVAALYGIE